MASDEKPPAPVISLAAFRDARLPRCGIGVFEHDDEVWLVVDGIRDRVIALTPVQAITLAAQIAKAASRANDRVEPTHGALRTVGRGVSLTTLCDWGGCGRQAACLRYDAPSKRWLPCCEECSEKTV